MQFKIISRHTGYQDEDIVKAMYDIGFRLQSGKVYYCTPTVNIEMKADDQGRYSFKHYLLGNVVFMPNKTSIYYNGIAIVSIENFDQSKLEIK